MKTSTFYNSTEIKIYPMPRFTRIKLQMHLPIAPRFLQDPSLCIHEKVSRLLLKYSKAVDGIPLSFSIEGITPFGRILDGGCVYVNTLLVLCVLKMAPGDCISSVDGMYLSAFPCEVDKEDGHTGDFRVKSIEKNGKIFGTTISEDDDF